MIRLRPFDKLRATADSSWKAIMPGSLEAGRDVKDEEGLRERKKKTSNFHNQHFTGIGGKT